MKKLLSILFRDGLRLFNCWAFAEMESDTRRNSNFLNMNPPPFPIYENKPFYLFKLKIYYIMFK
jgi:hypothetical protein